MPARLYLQPEKRALQVRIFGYLLSIVCGLLAIQIIIHAWSDIQQAPPAFVKDYLAYIQMMITFLTAILIAGFNNAATRSNEQLRISAAENLAQLQSGLSTAASQALTRLQTDLNSASAQALARLQAELAIETAKSTERIRAEFAAAVNEANERLRAQLTQSGDEFRARLGQTIPQKYNGYHSMFKAATKYFFAVRRLEEGIYPDEDLKAAAVAADDAVGTALIVDKIDRDAFFEFVTEAHFIAESARKSKNQGGERLILIWEKEGKSFGIKYNTLEKQFENKVS